MNEKNGGIVCSAEKRTTYLFRSNVFFRQLHWPAVSQPIQLDRGSILDIEREYVTPKFATKTIDEVR